jgi:replicative DNA helicase
MLNLPTGFQNLDTLTGGLQSSDVLIFLTPPLSGEMSFALSIALNAATTYQRRIGLFSPAMNKYQVVQRLLAMSADVDLYHLRTGWITDDEHRRLAQAARMLSRTSIWIDDRAELTLVQLWQRARQMAREQGVTLLLIDGLYLLQPHGEDKGDGHDAQEMSRSLKALACELLLPIVVLLPMPHLRAHHRSKDHQHFDQRDRSFAKDARQVLFLYRDRFSPPLPANKSMVMITVTIVKHRHGLVTEVALSRQAEPILSRDVEQLPSRKDALS